MTDFRVLAARLGEEARALDQVTADYLAIAETAAPDMEATGPPIPQPEPTLQAVPLVRPDSPGPAARDDLPPPQLSGDAVIRVLALAERTAASRIAEAEAAAREQLDRARAQARAITEQADVEYQRSRAAAEAAAADIRADAERFAERLRAAADEDATSLCNEAQAAADALASRAGEDRRAAAADRSAAAEILQQAEANAAGMRERALEDLDRQRGALHAQLRELSARRDALEAELEDGRRRVVDLLDDALRRLAALEPSPQPQLRVVGSG